MRIGLDGFFGRVSVWAQTPVRLRNGFKPGPLGCGFGVTRCRLEGAYAGASSDAPGHVRSALVLRGSRCLMGVAETVSETSMRQARAKLASWSRNQERMPSRMRPLTPEGVAERAVVARPGPRSDRRRTDRRLERHQRTPQGPRPPPSSLRSGIRVESFIADRRIRPYPRGQGAPEHRGVRSSECSRATRPATAGRRALR